MVVELRKERTMICHCKDCGSRPVNVEAASCVKRKGRAIAEVTESERIKAFEEWNTEYEKEGRISNRVGRRVGWIAACNWFNNKKRKQNG